MPHSSSLLLGLSRRPSSTSRFWRCYFESAACPRSQISSLLTLWATTRVRDPRRKSQSKSYFCTCRSMCHLPVTMILGDETASAILSEPEALTVDNAPAVNEAPQAPVCRVLKRRPSIILTMSEQLSLSDSTPPHSATNSMSDSEDKKRNKLGYQRISIACGMFLSCRPDVATRPLCRVNTRQVACMCDANR
jgi:hypothetical protein